MQIVEASAEDAEVFARLNRHVHSLHLENAPAFFREPTHKEATDAFRQLLAEEEARSFLAVEQGDAVGYLLVFMREREGHAFCPPRRLLYVEQISVEPAWQRQGVGHALLNRALKLAAESGINDIEVDTWAFNTEAQAFFEAAGFQPKVLRYQMHLPEPQE